MRKPLGVLFCCLVLGGCGTSQPFVHHVDHAVTTANVFLKDVMTRNYRHAYDETISAGLKYNPQFTFEQFSADWDAIQEKFGPIKKAKLDGYQLVPGRRVLQLYYTVTHETAGDMVYHLVLEANPEGNYTLFLMDVGNEQTYPPNLAEPLKMHPPDHPAEVLPE